MATKSGKGRKKRAPTRRQAIFRQELDRTDNAYQSAITAGYPESTAKSKSGSMAQVVRSELVVALRAQGCTPEFKARKIMQLLAAQMPKWNPGIEEFEYFENADIQLRALQEVNRVEDEYPAPKEQGGNSQNIQIIFPGNFADAMSKESAGD